MTFKNPMSKLQPLWSKTNRAFMRAFRGVAYNARLREILDNVVIHPLTLMIIFLVGAYIYLHAAGTFNTTTNFDANLLLFIAFVKFVSATFMITRTRWRRWTILSAGLVLSFYAVSVLYALSGYTFYNEGPPEHYAELLVFVRSGLVVGGVWVLMGIVQEWWIDGGYTIEGIRQAIRDPRQTWINRRQRKLEDRAIRKLEKEERKNHGI